MMNKWWVVGAVLVSAANLVFAEELSELGKYDEIAPVVGEAAGSGGIGAKLWAASDNYDASGVLFGVLGHYAINEQLWVLGQAYVGSMEDDSGFTEDELDIEGAVAWSFPYIDVGAGFRYAKFTYEGVYTEESYGPMLYLGSSQYFGDLPLGWYAGFSWMFYDLGEANGYGLEHYTLEGGLSYAIKQVSLTAGYRYKAYYADGIDYDQSGLTFGAVYHF
jgi:hypothetical protein